MTGAHAILTLQNTEGQCFGHLLTYILHRARWSLLKLSNEVSTAAGRDQKSSEKSLHACKLPQRWPITVEVRA